MERYGQFDMAAGDPIIPMNQMEAGNQSFEREASADVVFFPFREIGATWTCKRIMEWP
jgi:hypothetical protein